MNKSCRTLLIVDDDKPVRRSIAAFLEDSGYRVLQAADGTTALALFDIHAVELVITDLRMPTLDGLGVLASVSGRSAQVPVIVVSGAGVMSDAVSALRLGASDYLIKPIADMAVLELAVEKALAQRDLLLQNQQYRDQLEVANTNLRDSLRVLERDQRAGRQVQRRLLPRPMTLPNSYRVAHHIEPSLYLSGDFVDYAYLGERYLAFYLADVSGHGASSAFVTIWLKYLVSRMVREEGLFHDEDSFTDGANQLLRSINRELNATSLNHHVTLFVGVIDTHTQQMRYAVAGHLPMPILVTKHGAEFLKGSGKPVGIFSEVSWTVCTRALPKEFSLVCLSDGVLELLPPQALQEKEAYLLALLSEKAQDLETLRKAIGVDQLDETPDDIAILTINRGY